MKKTIFILFFIITGIANAQTGTDNRSYSLKEVDEAPTLEKTSFDEYFKKNFHTAEKLAAPLQVSFMVEKAGVVHDIKTFGEVKPEVTKEVIRVIKASPKWKPGKKDGKIVRVLYTATLKI